VDAEKCKAEQSTSTGSDSLPKHLYHGTTSSRLASILRDGLKPRGRRKGNWESYPSRPDMVYLTTAYAPFFAIYAVDEGEQGLIVEVDASKLNPTLLYPDEDFIAQALSHQKQMPLEVVHRQVRRQLSHYRHHAKDSIDAMGNVAHKGAIPKSAITRYALIDGKLQSDLFWIGLDPCISPMNYRFCGSKYRSIIAWIMGDRPDFDPDGFGEEGRQTMMKVNPEYMTHLQAMWANRNGITVHSMEAGNV